MRLENIVRLLVAAFLLLPVTGHAQEAYPNRPITFVVPAAAGGGIDRLARLLADKLRAKWNQTIIIENRGGAGGAIGTTHVAGAAPDGYTLLFAAAGHIAIDRGIKLSYDPEGWTPVSLLTVAPNVLVVNSNVKAHSVQEFVALAKAKTGGLTYASQGIGTTMHLSVEWLRDLAAVQMVHVPYGGGGPAMTDLLGGQVDAMFTEPSSILPNIRTGALRPLAVGSEKRDAMLPDVPAMSEIYPGFVSMAWQAVVAPQGTPKDIAQKLSDAFAEALRQPDVAASLRNSSLNAVGSSPEALATFIKEERVRWHAVIAKANIKFQQ